MLKEILARLFQLEVCQPLVEVLFDNVLLCVRLLLLFNLLSRINITLFLFFKLVSFQGLFIVHFRNLVTNFLEVLAEVLLQRDALSNNVAKHGLLL